MLEEYRKTFGAAGLTLLGYAVMSIWGMREAGTQIAEIPFLDVLFDGLIFAGMAGLGAYLPANKINGKNVIDVAKRRA